MSELILKIDADEAGLAAVKRATAELKEVLRSGGLSGSENMQKFSTELGAVAAQAKLAKAELTGLAGGLKQVVSAQTDAAASTKGVTAAAKEGVEKLSLLGMKYTQLAAAAQKYSVLQIDGAMRKDAASVQQLSANVSSLGVHLSDLVAKQRAEKGAVLLTNTEYEKQINIRTIIAAKTSEELGLMVDHTQALLRDSVARGELTAQEAVALGVKDRQIIAEVEYQALLAKGAAARAGYAAQAMAESSAAARLIGVPLSGKSAKSSASVFSENFAPPPEAAAQVKGLSAAYAGLAKEQELAIAMNRGWNASHNAKVMAEAASGLKAMGIAAAETTVATRGLHDATRGLAGASGALWLSYGNLVPMMAGYVTMAAAIKGVKLNADFESTTVYTQSIAEATGDYSMKLGILREKLLAVREVQDAPGELAAATKELVKAGFSESQAVGEIADMSRTATVVQEKLADVTKGVAAQYRAWHVEAVGAERGVSSLKQVANQMGYTAAASATDFGELNAMLAYTTELGPLTAVGFSELLAALAGMTNMGIRGTKAATALRSSILNLQHPSEKLAGELSRLRVPFSSTTDKGELKDLTTMFEDLGKSLAPLTTKARVDLLESIFNLRSLKGGASMLTMLNKSIDEGKFSFRGLTEEITKAGQQMTFVDDSAKKINDTLANQWKLFKADVAREFVASFEDANGAARGLVDSLRKAVADGTLRSLIDTVADLTGGMISLVKYAVEFKDAIGAYGKAFAAAAVISGMSSMLGYLEKLRLAQIAWNTASLANPLIALAAAGIWLIQQAYQSGQDQEAYADRANATSRSALGGRGVRTQAPAAEMQLGHSRSISFSSTDAFQQALAAERGLLGHSTPPGQRNPSAPGGGDDREPSAAMRVAARKAKELADAKAKLSEWETQRELQLLEVVNKAKADSREASFRDSLAMAEAERKALLLGEEEYLNRTRELKLVNLKAKLRDALSSEVVLSAKVSEAERFAAEKSKSQGTPDEVSKYQQAKVQLAGYQDKLESTRATIKNLSEDINNTPRLVELDDLARLNAAYESIQGIADVAREMRENSKIEGSIAGLNEGEAKKVRDIRKIELEAGKALQKALMDGKGNSEVDSIRDAFKEQAEAVESVYADEEARRKDWLAGATKSFADYAHEAENSFKSVGEVVGKVFTGLEDIFINFVKTGKVSFRDLIDTMLSESLRLASRQMLGSVAASWGDSNSMLGGLNMALSSVFHSGTESVGSGAAPSRAVPSALFANAPRLHNGLAPDEFPAILQSGERVTSRAQVAAEKRAGAAPIFNQVVNVDARGSEGGANLEERLRVVVKEAAAMGYRLVVDEFLRGLGPIAARV